MESQESIPLGTDSAGDQQQTTVTSVLEVTGVHCWLALFVSVCLFFLWKKFGVSRFQDWQDRRASDVENLHRDDDAFLLQEAAIQSSRQRLQAQMDAAAERHKVKLLEKEEAKRKERVLVYENMKKGRSSASGGTTEDRKDESGQTQNKPKGERLRGDYYPLMSSDSGSCFRPSRRGGGSSGG